MKHERLLTSTDNLTKYGYEELPNCYIKRFSGYWIIRADKHTRKLKYWNSLNGKTKDATPYIQDLIKAGIVI